MVVANKPARYPDLEMVRERIEADFKSDRIKTQTQQAVQEIIEGYRVDIRLDEFDAKALSARKVR